MQINGGPTVGQLVAIMVGAIPILGIAGWTLVRILGPIGQAWGRRISGEARGTDLADRRLEELALELEQVRAQLAETNERLDFTERLLARSRSEALPPGPVS